MKDRKAAPGAKGAADEARSRGDTGERAAKKDAGGVQPRRATVRVIGIDPGSVIFGFAVIDIVAGSCRHVTHGHVRLGRATMSDRLMRAHGFVLDLVREFEPDEAAIELAFVGKSVRSALALGQARGALLCALAGVPGGVSEYAPSRVKSLAAGSGGASKETVQRFVSLRLGLVEPLQADAADASAVAICHAQARQGVAGAAPSPGSSRGRRRRSGGRGLRR